MPKALLAALFALVPLCGFAQVDAYGDWFVVSIQDHGGDVIAATGSGKEVLAYRCFAAQPTCVYVLVTQTACEALTEIPMLLNAEAGSTIVTGTCMKTDTGDQLVLKPYEAIEAILQGGDGQVGFSMPVEAGEFQSLRFSVRGGEEATREAERRALAGQEATGVRSHGSASL
jgi:hypothetical protein